MRANDNESIVVGQKSVKDDGKMKNSGNGEKPSSCIATSGNSRINNNENNDKQEDSSDGGKVSTRSGSGSGGYNADCSSSDSSFNNNNNKADSCVGQGQQVSTATDGGSITNKDAERDEKKICQSNNDFNLSPSNKSSSMNFSDDTKMNNRGLRNRSIYNNGSSIASSSSSPILPQWNGVKIKHPMDPRIDLSTVAIMKDSSQLYSLQNNLNKTISNGTSGGNNNTDINNNNINNGVNQNIPPPNNHTSIESSSLSFPCVEQYTKLLESVRPFFHQDSGPKPATTSLDEGHILKPSRESCSNNAVENLNVNVEISSAAACIAASSRLNNKDGGSNNDDDSSMAVLAPRSKRKHYSKQHSSSSSSGEDAAVRNGSSLSESNSEKDERVQRQQKNHDVAVEHRESLRMENNDLLLHQRDVAVNESCSGSSSGRNNQVEVQRQQLLHQNDNNNHHHEEVVRQDGIPTMVSEYSSSARNGRSSSGTSSNNNKNNNTSLLSTSGSGSGGNTGTGSGTGSGSNQGGSSGSGNDQDQGGTSSNGNGSAGSGNEIGKGSSEELMMDNNEDNDNNDRRESRRTKINNDALNNSSQTFDSNKANGKASTVAVIDPKNDSLDKDNSSKACLNHHHETQYHYNHHQSLPSQHRSSNDNNKTHDNDEGKNTAREKKLQDKKRKRMNMRREYEDKMEQEMELSESSSDGRGEVIHRPGKPTTLDKAVSFTKTAKLVVKASLPFTVIYTNAAYSKLSGIDSHKAVGKPISDLILSLPSGSEQQSSSQQEDLQEEKNPSPSIEIQQLDERAVDSKNHVAAEAAGRARAAASKNDNIEVGIENLVMIGGCNKLNKVNIRCNPLQMLGRNVKIIKSKRNEEEGSNGGSSITSNSADSPYNMIECTMSISPVISSPELYAAAEFLCGSKRNEQEKDGHQQKSKRRKHHYHSQSTSELNHHNRKRQIISHYMIQLVELFEGDSMVKKNGVENELQSSFSTKATVRHHGENESKMTSGNKKHTENEIESLESSSNYKHVSAIA